MWEEVQDTQGESRDLTPDPEAACPGIILEGSEVGSRYQCTCVCVHIHAHVWVSDQEAWNWVEANVYVQRAVEKRRHGAFEKEEKVCFGSSSKSELGTKKRRHERGRKDSLWNLRTGIHLPGNGKMLKGVEGKIICSYLG